MDKIEVKECFKNAKKAEDSGKKHKGLLIKLPNDKLAIKYLEKAKKNLELCELYRKNGYDYMVPEAWYYTLYYCALAILSKFAVESRNQKCTAYFLKYIKDKELIDYDEEFINRIIVYSDKEEFSDVDERESARYGPEIESQEVKQQYEQRMKICTEAISQCRTLVFSANKFNLPEELLKI